MTDEQHNPSTPRPKTGLGRQLLLRLSSTAPTRRCGRHGATRMTNAAEDDQCRLRPDYSRMTRGYREF